MNTKNSNTCHCRKACPEYFGETCPSNNPAMLNVILISYLAKHLLHILFSDIEQDFLINNPKKAHPNYNYYKLNELKNLSLNERIYWALKKWDKRPHMFTNEMNNPKSKIKEQVFNLFKGKYYMVLCRELPVSIIKQVCQQINHILNKYTLFQCQMLISPSWIKLNKFDFEFDVFQSEFISYHPI